MPEAGYIQNNFTAGEISPRLFGRNDLQKYRNGLGEQLNFLTQKHGGAIRRSGTRFVAGAKDSDAGVDRTARLIRFQPSADQSYILEFGHLYIRVYRDRGQLQHGDVFDVTGATWAAGTSSITIGAHGVQVGQQVSVKGVLTNDAAFPIGFNGTFTVTGITATTVEYAQAVAPPGAYVVSGTDTLTLVVGVIPTEIVTPYTESDLALLKVAQSADILIIAHPLYEPRLLCRAAGADSDPAVWSLVTMQSKDGPYLTVNSVAAATLTAPVGAIGALVNITIVNATVAVLNGGQGFISTDVGRVLRWKTGANWEWGRIEVINTRLSIDVRLGSASTAGTTADWAVGAWSDTTGWPFCTVFHESRLWFGGNTTLPQTIWSSATADFFNFRPTSGTPNTAVADDDAITRTLDDDQLNQIHWLKSDAKGLAALTSGGIFAAKSTAEDVMTPGNMNVVKQVGESAVQRPPPRQVSGATLHVSSASRKVREFVFRVDQDRFVAPDVTILSEHITLTGLVDSALQLEPDVILWTLREDGVIAAMTYERDEAVVAWSRHEVGGDVESMDAIRDGDDDLIWLVVRRVIGGSVKRYVEFIEALFSDLATVEDAFYVDSGLTYNQPVAITAITLSSPIVVTAPGHGIVDGDRVRIRAVVGTTELNDTTWIAQGPVGDTFELWTLDGSKVDGSEFTPYESGGAVYREVSQVSGLAHLAGETVRVLADGGKQVDAVVTGGGSVALERPASIVHVGLAVMARLVSLPVILTETAQVDPRGRPQRIDHAVVRFNRSLGGTAGGLRLDEIVQRYPQDPMNVHTPMFTGQQRLPISGRHDLDPVVIIETDDPLPMNVLSIVLEGGAGAI